MAKKNGSTVSEKMQGIFSGKDELTEFVRESVRKNIEEVVAEEVQKHIGAGKYERTQERTGYRNGYKPRSITTRAGEIDFDLPQVRDCDNGPYRPSFLRKWQRTERAVLVACCEMYFQGVSTRNVKKVLKAMGGIELSAGQVSRIAAELDETLAEFRGRYLDKEEYPFLMIDARYESIRTNGHVTTKGVLVTIGVNLSRGKREVLDWRVADTESRKTWSSVFRDLKKRGLHGVKVLVSDAHEGIKAAMKRDMQGVLWQRCRVHFKRELGRKVACKDKKEVKQDIQRVFSPEDHKECLMRGEEMAIKWEKRNNRVSRMIRSGLEDCLTVCAFPRELRHRLRSTNMVESIMKQLRKRTKVIDSFPNEASCHRIIGARLLETHEDWQARHRAYMNMEHLKRPEYRDLFNEIGLK